MGTLSNHCLVLYSNICSMYNTLSTMHTDPRTLGRHIAGLRHAQGWSQRRLADAAGVSHGYIALLELGRLPSPGKFRLDAVARALNLRTSDALLQPAPPPTFEPPTPLRQGASTVRRFPPPTPSAFEPTDTVNVLGGLEQLRPAGARPLPVFRWG